MTDLPRGYDDWRLSGPDDDRAECPHCRNTDDPGVSPCLCSEIDDDYGDYLTEKKES